MIEKKEMFSQSLYKTCSKEELINLLNKQWGEIVRLKKELKEKDKILKLDAKIRQEVEEGLVEQVVQLKKDNKRLIHLGKMVQTSWKVCERQVEQLKIELNRVKASASFKMVEQLTEKNKNLEFSYNHALSVLQRLEKRGVGVRK